MAYMYPYGDSQQLNLSWFLAKFKELYEYIINLDPNDISLAAVLSRFTNEYDSSMNYIPGDYTIHEGFIYKANQTTTGEFDPNAWDTALPVNDIQGLRILMGGLSTDLTTLEQKVDEISDSITAPQNALMLGMKNDGSEDCTAIFNNAINDGAIFFPDGVYRFDGNITVKNNVLGTANDRKFRNGSGNGANLIFYNNDSYSINIDTAVSIENINIVASASSCIHITNNSNIPVSIDNITIVNMQSGCAIEIQPSLRNSRAAYITNCEIFGTADNTAIAIAIRTNAPDCVIIGCEIMGVRQGIINSGGPLLIENCHIWCGQLSGTYRENWWSGTYAVNAVALTRIINCYFDTCYHAVIVSTNAPVIVNNLLYLCDTSITQPSSEGYIFHFYQNVYTRNLKISNSTISTKRSYNALIQASSRYYQGAIFENNVLIGDAANWTPIIMDFSPIGYFDINETYQGLVNSKNYIEIAKINCTNFGYNILRTIKGAFGTETRITTTATTITINTQNITGQYAQIFVSYDTTTKFLTIWLYNHQTFNDPFIEFNEAYGYSYIKRYKNVIGSGYTRLVGEQIADGSALTAITENTSTTINKNTGEITS